MSSLRYENHNAMFDQIGFGLIQIYSQEDRLKCAVISIEELYQHFRARTISEVEARSDELLADAGQEAILRAANRLKEASNVLLEAAVLSCMNEDQRNRVLIMISEINFLFGELISGEERGRIDDLLRDP